MQVNVVKVSTTAKSIQQFTGGKVDGESQLMFCCKMYGMKCNGLNLDRLSRIHLKEIPYIDEMLARKHELIDQSGISLKNGHCKEYGTV